MAPDKVCEPVGDVAGVVGVATGVAGVVAGVACGVAGVAAGGGGDLAAGGGGDLAGGGGDFLAGGGGDFLTGGGGDFLAGGGGDFLAVATAVFTVAGVFLAARSLRPLTANASLVVFLLVVDGVSVEVVLLDAIRVACVAEFEGVLLDVAGVEEVPDFAPWTVFRLAALCAACSARLDATALLRVSARGH